MILDDLVAATTTRLAAAKKKRPLAIVKQEALAAVSSKPSFIDQLDHQFGIIAEIKQASPSKGLIARQFDFQQIASDYAKASISAISVLTEPTYFHGSLDILKTVAKEVQVPVLRKDFVIDDYMLYEAKAAGASMVLLIAAILTPEKLKQLYELAQKLGLEVLLECHSPEEVATALPLHPRLIGVNNRDLRDFSVDIHHAEYLRKVIPSSIKVIAESGLKKPQQLVELKQAGIDGVLIGETFMRAADKQTVIHQFQEAVNDSSQNLRAENASGYSNR